MTPVVLIRDDHRPTAVSRKFKRALYSQTGIHLGRLEMAESQRLQGIFAAADFRV
jgi:hypothetical protein